MEYFSISRNGSLISPPCHGQHMTHHVGTGGVLQHHRGLVAYFVHHVMNSSAPTTRARVGCFSIMIRDWWLCSPCHGQHKTHHVGTGGYFSIITDWWLALSTTSWTEQHPAQSYRLDTSASSRTGGFVHHVMNSTRPNTGARNDDCGASRGTMQ